MKVDMIKRAENEINKFHKVILKDMGKFYSHEIRIYDTEKDKKIYCIEVENCLGGYSSRLEDIVRDSKYAILVKSGEIKGHYDWESKTYFPDYSWVEFRFY